MREESHILLRHTVSDMRHAGDLGWFIDVVAEIVPWIFFMEVRSGSRLSEYPGPEALRHIGACHHAAGADPWLEENSIEASRPRVRNT